MRRKIRLFLSFFMAFLCLYTWMEGSVPILPLDQVKAGMKGKGRSVFGEGRIEEFEVEILGVLRNIGPKRNIILAKLKGDILDYAGVIEGMSGSPVYVDGKLIGAVAYSFGSFVKEPIAGITPISEMLSIPERKAPQSSFLPQVPFKKHLSLEELFEINRDLFLSRLTYHSDGKTLAPLSVPLVFSGFSSHAFERARPFFSKLGFTPIRGTPTGQALEKISAPDLSLQEGDPVAIQLISGDMDLSAVGTVTHIDGSKILAFGHSIYNLGTVDYAMTKAKVITVVPSLSTSFKIAATDALIGRFSQDRDSGLLGEIGKMPRLIPINVQLMNPQGNIKDFKLKVVDDKILTPFLVNVSVGSILTAEERMLGNLSLEFRGNIYLESEKSVPSILIEDLFSGQFNTSITDISSLLSSVVYFLINNEFEDIGIHRIDLAIQTSEQAKFSYLEKVLLDRYEASPGERIQIKVYYRTFRGESVLQEVGILAPPLPPGSEFKLVIGDAQSMHQVEMSQYRVTAFVPRSLAQLIRILSNLRKNNRIYFKIIASKPGLFLKGEEMPNLPPTMKSMFSSPRAAASAPTELDESTLNEYQLPIPYVFKGKAVIPIKIRK